MQTTTQNLEILKHNLAGELASLYVIYLSRMNPRNKHSYFAMMWNSEYKSRLQRFENDPSLIETLNNSYNEFYRTEVAEKDDVKRKFIFQA